MNDSKEYLVQPLENGNVMISEEVIASIAALSVREVEGVYGLSVTPTLDLSNIIGKKNLRKGIRVTIDGEDVEISCNLVVKLGSAVMDVAAKVQQAIVEAVAGMTGVRPKCVNVNVCGVAPEKPTAKK